MSSLVSEACVLSVATFIVVLHSRFVLGSGLDFLSRWHCFTAQTDHDLDHLYSRSYSCRYEKFKDLNMWDTDPTSETCAKSCRSHGSHPATWARPNRSSWKIYQKPSRDQRFVRRVHCFVVRAKILHRRIEKWKIHSELQLHTAAVEWVLTSTFV